MASVQLFEKVTLANSEIAYFMGRHLLTQVSQD
jgi:hypothetical protein